MQSVTRDDYFTVMRETAVVVSRIMANVVARVADDAGRANDARFLGLARHRASADCLKMKAFFLRLAYEASGGRQWEDVVSVCGAAAELLNVSHYSANYVLDGKGDCRTVADAGPLVVAAMLFREAAERMLVNYCRDSSLGSAPTEQLLMWFSEISYEVYRGQFIDLNVLVFDRATDLSIPDFNRLYWERCYCFGGAFLERLARVAVLLSGACPEVGDSLAAFGRHHGTALQMVNDIGDLVPTSAASHANHAKYQDQFADVTAGKLTMPLYIGLMDPHCSDLIARLRSSRAVEAIDQERLVAALWEKGAIAATRDFARQEEKRAKAALFHLPRSAHKDMLSIMAATAKTNKYYVTLRDLCTGILGRLS